MKSGPLIEKEDPIRIIHNDWKMDFPLPAVSGFTLKISLENFNNPYREVKGEARPIKAGQSSTTGLPQAPARRKSAVSDFGCS